MSLKETLRKLWFLTWKLQITKAFKIHVLGVKYHWKTSEGTYCDICYWRNVTFFFVGPPSKMCDFTELQNIIKFDLKVEKQWSERFWKADDPYFQKILIASTNFSFFMPFWNHNGIYAKSRETLNVTSKYRSGSKKTQNWKRKKCEDEVMSFLTPCQSCGWDV